MSPQRERSGRYWSGEVTRTSHALDLDPNVFTWDNPRKIAASLKRSAETSRQRKASPFRSAMSMLTFYVNRAGGNLSAERRAVLERAKDELRIAFGRPPKRTAAAPTAASRHRPPERARARRRSPGRGSRRAAAHARS